MRCASDGSGTGNSYETTRFRQPTSGPNQLLFPLDRTSAGASPYLDSDEPLLAAGAGEAAGVLAAAGAADAPVVVVELAFAAELADDELYKSEYHPPPLRMKPPPREICRLASAALHLGHIFSGASEMDCWASQ